MDEKKLIAKAFEFQKNAYVPYSKFPIGAAVLCKDGNYVGGANIENASYGATMCGERVAIFSTIAQGYKKEDIVAIAIVSNSDEPATPCGACRQVLSELIDPATPIILANKTKVLRYSLKDLFPYAFDKESLNA
jgi:cytidine deaminase